MFKSFFSMILLAILIYGAFFSKYQLPSYLEEKDYSFLQTVDDNKLVYEKRVGYIDGLNNGFTLIGQFFITSFKEGFERYIEWFGFSFKTTFQSTIVWTLVWNIIWAILGLPISITIDLLINFTKAIKLGWNIFFLDASFKYHLGFISSILVVTVLSKLGGDDKKLSVDNKKTSIDNN